MVVCVDNNLCVGFAAESCCLVRSRHERVCSVLPVEKNVTLVGLLVDGARWSWLVWCCEKRPCLLNYFGTGGRGRFGGGPGQGG